MENAKSDLEEQKKDSEAPLELIEDNLKESNIKNNVPDSTDLMVDNIEESSKLMPDNTKELSEVMADNDMKESGELLDNLNKQLRSILKIGDSSENDDERLKGEVVELNLMPEDKISVDTDASESDCSLKTPQKKSSRSWFEQVVDSESPASSKSGSSYSSTKKIKIGFETDVEVLKRREKQILYGKNSKGYHNYIENIPKNKRLPHHLRTPNKYLKYSRRSWDNQIKIWRKRLHEHDPKFVDDKCDELIEIMEPILRKSPVAKKKVEDTKDQKKPKVVTKLFE